MSLMKCIETLVAVIQAGGNKFPNPGESVKKMVKLKM